MNDHRLERTPTPEQKRRLGFWLNDLLWISRTHGIYVVTQDGEVRVVDALSGHTIGLDLAYLLDGGQPPRLSSLDCDGSIMDGVWLVDTPQGPIEQRLLGK